MALPLSCPQYILALGERWRMFRNLWLMTSSGLFGHSIIKPVSRWCAHCLNSLYSHRHCKYNTKALSFPCHHFVSGSLVSSVCPLFIVTKLLTDHIQQLFALVIAVNKYTYYNAFWKWESKCNHCRYRAVQKYFRII